MNLQPTYENFVVYEKLGEEDEDGGRPVYNLTGIHTKVFVNGSERDAIYLWRRYNTFDEKPTLIPDDYKLRIDDDDCDDCKNLQKYCEKCEKHMRKYYENYRFGSKIMAKDYNPIKIEHPGTDIYYIHDNGGRPFKVYVDTHNQKIYVYRRNQNLIYFDEWENYETTNVYTFDEEVEVCPAFDNCSSEEDTNYLTKDNSESDKLDMDKYYDQFVCEVSYLKIWIPEGCYLTWGNFIKKDNTFKGNSILVHLDKIDQQNKYLWIGQSIIEFTTDDEIQDYYSVVGNSDVPYPVAVGQKYMFFMLDMIAQDLEKYSKLSEEQIADAYAYFYGHSCVNCHKSKCNCNKENYENIKLDCVTIAKREY